MWPNDSMFARWVVWFWVSEWGVRLGNAVLTRVGRQAGLLTFYSGSDLHGGALTADWRCNLGLVSILRPQVCIQTHTHTHTHTHTSREIFGEIERNFTELRERCSNWSVNYSIR